MDTSLAEGTNQIFVYAYNSLGVETNDSIEIIRLPATGIPFVNITSVVSYVNYDVSSIEISGTNNAQIAGMWLTNNLAGHVGFTAEESWTAPSIPLAVGDNVIVIFGSNLVDNITNDMITVTRGDPGTGEPVVDCTNNNAES